MRKTLILALGGMAAVGALVLSPAAQAEPITLTAVQMDAITAGGDKGKGPIKYPKKDKVPKKYDGSTYFVDLFVAAVGSAVSNQPFASAELTGTVAVTFQE